jgi:vacuolar-type H+-ATPase catalytic subunit A/Vma1
MLQTEKAKNQQLEVEMYEEYENKLSEMKSYFVDKIDEFLKHKGSEIYEQARRDVLNDPRMAEHKVTLDKIVDLTSSYLSDEGLANVSSKKIEEANKAIDELKGQVKIMEARNIRLSTENTKLNEAVRQSQELISESKKLVTKSKKETVVNEQKERTEKAENVTGRGKTVDDEKVVVIGETTANSDSDLDQILVLSGLKAQN